MSKSNVPTFFHRFRPRPSPSPAWIQVDPVTVALRFTATPARLIIYAVVIAVVTIAVGLLATLLAIEIAGMNARMGRFVIVSTALVLCLPLLFMINLPFRMRTKPCEINFGEQSLHLTVDGTAYSINYAELTELIWCNSTEYARLVLRSTAHNISLLVGVAKPLPGHSPNLPELPNEVLQRLERAGLASRRSAGYLLFRR